MGQRNFGFYQGKSTLSQVGSEKIPPNTPILRVENNNRKISEQVFQSVIKTIRSLIKQ